MGATENAECNAKVLRNLGLFCNKIAEIIGKSSTSLQLKCDMQTSLLSLWRADITSGYCSIHLSSTV